MFKIGLGVWKRDIEIRNAKHTEANICNTTCHACIETSYAENALGLLFL